MSYCKKCGAEIVWIKTPAGKHMPCDAGKVYFSEDKNGKELFVTADGKTVRGSRRLYLASGAKIGYIPHWATCPAAEEFKENKVIREKVDDTTMKKGEEQ